MTNSEHLRALYAAMDGLLTDLDANGGPETAAASLQYHLKQNGLKIAASEPVVVRIHHGDPDSHARSYNSGWDDALRDAIRDIPEGVNDGWSRYDTDYTHVLTIHAEGQTWDVIAPKEPKT